ncbi:heparan-alpha-glucosaminide N-acetyltransferase, partial [Nostoc sp. NIES-2111]
MVETRDPFPVVAPRPVPAATGSARLPVVDAARGVALAAMVVYHFTWDLGFYGFIGLQAGHDPAWRIFAKLIAGSFLALVGVSLVLASRDGLRRDAFLRRLAMVAGGAALISLATWWAMPDSFVYFGILHCIAVCSVLALPFLRAPLWLVAIVAILCLALPSFATSAAFDGPWLFWLGLAETVRPTNDFEPVLPWFGVVLGGVLAARLALRAGLDATLARWRGDDPPGPGLRFARRHSLLLSPLPQPLPFRALLVGATPRPLPSTPRPAAAPVGPVMERPLGCPPHGHSPLLS